MLDPFPSAKSLFCKEEAGKTDNHWIVAPNFANFPFGADDRQCIGDAFAWAEGTLILATLAQRCGSVWHRSTDRAGTLDYSSGKAWKANSDRKAGQFRRS